MKSFFVQDLKRGILNKGFFAGMLLVSAVLLPVAVLDAPMDGSRSYLYGLANIFHASGFTPLAAVFPVLAYSTVYCKEHNEGYLWMILHRAGFARFAKVRISAAAVSGGLMIAVPFLLASLTAYAGGAHGIPAGTDEGFLEGTKIMAAVMKYGDWYIIAGKVLIGFLFGALWALVGLAFSVWIPNRYVGLLAPFVLYEALWMFMGDVPYNPGYLVTGDNVDHGNYPLAVLIGIVYIGMTIPVIYRGLRQEKSG